MTTIKLHVSDKVLDKVLWLLGHFRSDEVHIIEDESFEATKKYLHTEHDKLIKNESKLYDIEDIDEDLDQVIKKYEA